MFQGLMRKSTWQKGSGCKLKILMLAGVFFPDTIGGARRPAYHLSDELSEKGHEVHIVTRNRPAKMPHEGRLKPHLFVRHFPSALHDFTAFTFLEIKYCPILAKKQPSDTFPLGATNECHSKT
jgi:glycosyltransferase involved in cell wall biosynthesis